MVLALQPSSLVDTHTCTGACICAQDPYFVWELPLVRSCC